MPAEVIPGAGQDRPTPMVPGLANPGVVLTPGGAAGGGLGLVITVDDLLP